LVLPFISDRLSAAFRCLILPVDGGRARPRPRPGCSLLLFTNRGCPGRHVMLSWRLAYVLRKSPCVDVFWFQSTACLSAGLGRWSCARM